MDDALGRQLSHELRHGVSRWLGKIEKLDLKLLELFGDCKIVASVN